MNIEPSESVIIKAEALISECGNYRYWISRIWDEDKDIGMFVCLNPSKATSLRSDNTLSNCNNLALKWEWGGFYIVNLFAYRATKQSVLNNQFDKIGPDNDKFIKAIAEKVDRIVLAWGSGYKTRAKIVLELLEDKQLYCLKKNKSGGYRHPGRIKLEDYEKPVAI